jgi:hypothetical protein
MASRSASRTVILAVGPVYSASGGGAGAIASFGAGVVAGSTLGDIAGSLSAISGAADAASSALASSPSPNSSAIGVLTATPSVPSGTRMRPRVPSSTASTSIVALSVSISAITSPEDT